MWNSSYSREFIKQSKKIARTPYYELLKRAIGELEKADSPAQLGTRKHGSYYDAYSYKIGKSIRLIYRVNFDNVTIEFVAIGTHKEVYGND